VLEEEWPLEPIGRHGPEDDGLGQAQQTNAANAEALPQACPDLRSHRASHCTTAPRRRAARGRSCSQRPANALRRKPAAPKSQGHAMSTAPTYAPASALAMKPRLESWEMREKRPCLGPSKPASSRPSTAHASTAPLQKVVPTASMASATRKSA